MPLTVESIRIRGEWFRHTAADLPPLPARTDPPDSRWQRGHVVDALYLADSPATVWAEWYRHLAENGIPPAQTLPRDLWRWRVDVDVVDLRSEEQLARVGLSMPTPGRSTWPPFQVVGEELWREGWPGLVAPSAARPAGRTLCLFRGKRLLPTGTRPVGASRVDTVPAPPVGMTT